MKNAKPVTRIKACIHKCVCRHLVASDSDPDGYCAVTEVCRFYVPEHDGTKPVKRAYKKRLVSDPPINEELEDDSGITEKQFKKAKKKIQNAKQNKGLNDSQKRALKAMKGLRFKSMSGAQKQQILNIANDL
ncbi:MAG TPA: hypothetical protein VMW42_00250 [Desulfatiglandales bacterium]|nr:hypothetical protein [Desulfatiglandales bacterium]